MTLDVFASDSAPAAAAPVVNPAAQAAACAFLCGQMDVEAASAVRRAQWNAQVSGGAAATAAVAHLLLRRAAPSAAAVVRVPLLAAAGTAAALAAGNFTQARALKAWATPADRVDTA